MKPLMQTPARLAPMLYMTLGMAMWAIIEIIAGLLSKHYSSFQIVWMRYSIHLLFMLLVFGPRARLRLVRTHHLGLQLGRGMLMMGMHLTFIFAIRSIPTNTTMAGFWVVPLLLLGLSAWRGEPPRASQWLLTLVAYAGVLLILRPLTGLAQPASLLSLGMALCFALYIQMTRAMPDEDLLASLFYTAFSVWIVLSGFMPFYWVPPAASDLWIFAAIGLLGFVGILGFDKAAELAPTWVSAPYGYVQPVLVILFDWFMRDIFPGRLSLAAIGLLLAYLAFLAGRGDWKRLIPGYHHV